MNDVIDPVEDRVLVFALFGGDSAFTERVLRTAGIDTRAVEVLDDLLRLITEGAGAVVRRQAMTAGFELHLAKPIEPAALIAAIATLARIGSAMK